MYVCMYVCMYVYIYIYMYICIYVLYVNSAQGVDENAKAVVMWDVRTGEEKRAFKHEGAKDQVLLTCC